MTTLLRFGIALYSPLKEGKGHHWVLVVGQPGDVSFNGKVNVFQIAMSSRSQCLPDRNVFQIVHTKDGKGYESFHKEAVFAKSGRYYRLVDLGVLRNVIEDHVLQLGVIEEQPAGQEGYKIPDGKNWSCAWWVIRALRELVKEGVPIPKLPANNLELYNRVVVPLAAEMNSALAPLHM